MEDPPGRDGRSLPPPPVTTSGSTALFTVKECHVTVFTHCLHKSTAAAATATTKTTIVEAAANARATIGVRSSFIAYHAHLKSGSETAQSPGMTAVNTEALTTGAGDNPKIMLLPQWAKIAAPLNRVTRMILPAWCDLGLSPKPQGNGDASTRPSPSARQSTIADLLPASEARKGHPTAGTTGRHARSHVPKQRALSP